MSRVYEGVKLFWSPKELGNPYHYFDRSAGTIFLHNAIQSKLKLINQKKIIFWQQMTNFSSISSTL